MSSRRVFCQRLSASGSLPPDWTNPWIPIFSVGNYVVLVSCSRVEVRKESLKRMIAEAERVGADAVVAVRFVTSQVMTGAAELLAYGTAVKIEPVQ